MTDRELLVIIAGVMLAKSGRRDAKLAVAEILNRLGEPERSSRAETRLFNDIVAKAQEHGWKSGHHLEENGAQ